MLDLNSLTSRMSRAQILSVVDSAKRSLSIWYGSVSAGKTIASLIAFLLAVRIAPRSGLIVIVGRTLQTIYQNVIQPLQDPHMFGSVIASQVIYTPGATKAVILGREVMIVGAHNVEAVGRIQGATIGLAYVDEATLLPEVFWNMLVTRLRVSGARLLATMNPASRNHWLRKNWLLKADAVDLIAFHFTMADNPSLETAYIDRMKRSYTGVFYDRFIKGEWTNAEGAVYPMWDPRRHQIRFEDMPPIYRLLGTGIDFGTTHATSAIMAGITREEKPRLVLMDEYRYDPRDHDNRRQAPSTTALQLKSWLAKDHQPRPSSLTPEFQIIDPAAAHFQEELFKLGITTWHADHEVLPGIGTISRLLDNDQMIVTDRCKGWLQEVTEYAWDAKATANGNDEPVKDNDDSLDAGRYIVHSTRQSYEFDIAA